MKDTAPRIIKIEDETRLVELVCHLDELDGHVTMFKFSTGWKLCFGTPWLEGAVEGGDRDAIDILDAAPTLFDLLERLKRRPQDFPHLPIASPAARRVVSEQFEPYPDEDDLRRMFHD